MPRPRARTAPGMDVQSSQPHGPPAPPGPGSPPSPGALTAQDVRILREIALESISCGLRHRRPLAVKPEGYSPALLAAGATFVTLTTSGELRGCVGSIEARRSLVEDVAENAFAAAFRDTRFPPLTAEEFPSLELHISRLTPLSPLSVRDRAELLAALRPGVDGLLLEDLPHRATFLPQVWEHLPDAEGFVSHLFLKAGLGSDHWSGTVRCFRYEVEEI